MINQDESRPVAPAGSRLFEGGSRVHGGILAEARSTIGGSVGPAGNQSFALERVTNRPSFPVWT